MDHFGLVNFPYTVESYEDPWTNFSWTFEDINNFMSVYR